MAPSPGPSSSRAPVRWFLPLSPRVFRPFPAAFQSPGPCPQPGWPPPSGAPPSPPAFLRSAPSCSPLTAASVPPLLPEALGWPLPPSCRLHRPLRFPGPTWRPFPATSREPPTAARSTPGITGLPRTAGPRLFPLAGARPASTAPRPPFSAAVGRSSSFRSRRRRRPRPAPARSPPLPPPPAQRPGRRRRGGGGPARLRSPGCCMTSSFRRLPC